ncbi:hypothetical protein [Actinomyces sp.]
MSLAHAQFVVEKPTLPAPPTFNSLNGPRSRQVRHPSPVTMPRMRLLADCQMAGRNADEHPTSG